MTVSESHQLLATQIAYADLDLAFAVLSEETTKPVTLQAALQYAYENGSDLGFLKKYLKPDGSFLDEYSFANDWVITAVTNQNVPGETGLYACILDTGDANILACRGSEDMENIMNWKQDWYEADLKLLNSEMTKQEEALLAFMRKNEDILNNQPWVATGHSLGGALADYAAIRSVDLGFDNFSGAINFDGPGHSQEFIKKYYSDIMRINGKMLHVKASIVGSILFDIPGVNQEYIEVAEESQFLDEDGNPLKQTTTIGVFADHDTQNWVRAKDQGGLKRRENQQGTIVELLIEKLTRGTDRLPAYLGNSIVFFINLVVTGGAWAKNFSDDHPALIKFLTVSVTAFLLSHPALIDLSLRIVATIALTVLAFLSAIIIGEMVIEFIEELIQEIAAGICKTISWLKDKAVDLYTAMLEFIRSIPQYLHSLTPGVKYASSNPYFRADPELLRDYARRLAAVNARLMSLDRDMDQLYLQVGLMDVGDILLTNIITSYSARLGLARNYLNSAADALENADNQALRYMGG